MPWRKADDSMEQIGRAPINESQDAVLARSKPDRSRRHGWIEHSDAESHRESIATLLQAAYIQGRRIRKNSVTSPAGDRIPTNTRDSDTRRYRPMQSTKLAATVNKACQTAPFICGRVCRSALAGTESLFLPEISTVIRSQGCLELPCNNVSKPIQSSGRQMANIGEVLDVLQLTLHVDEMRSGCSDES
jgi:hypothetical protein